MYIPHSFRFEDRQEKISFITQYSFASIITNVDAIPVATLLPFTVYDNGEKLFVRSHFSAANEQAKHIENATSLVIFNGPHAYISPANYDKRESVPTWNYITVHAYGTARVIHNEKAKRNMLEQMIASYESSYQQQFENLPEKFITGMMKGIVAFEIEVTRLDGQKKLSQNKTTEERTRIIQSLEQSGDATERELATYMHNTK
jgi:transcriptional regulator